ncbi:MAG: GIY-YIG nuclease family protein, partial [bacterium]
TAYDAIVREKRLKKWKRLWKLRLIELENPEWRDLYYDFVDRDVK